MATKTWTQTSGNLASTDANWSGGTKPQAGDDIVFDATSVANCTWDLAITCGNFLLDTTYSGVVTVAATFGFANLTVNGGTFTSATAYWLSCSGNIVKGAGGTITGSVARLKMVGVTQSITGWTTNIDGVWIASGTTTMNMSKTIDRILQVDASAVLNIATGTITSIFFYATSSFLNNGTIQAAGTGQFQFTFYGTDATVSPGVITCPVTVRASGATGNRICSLGANTSLGSTLTVSSSNAFTMTLTHGNNYTLTVAGLVTLGATGIITQGTGAWVFGPYTQSGASSIFNQGANLDIRGACTISAGQFVGDAAHPIYVWAGVSIVGATSVAGMFRSPLNPNLIASMMSQGAMD